MCVNADIQLWYDNFVLFGGVPCHVIPIAGQLNSTQIRWVGLSLSLFWLWYPGQQAKTAFERGECNVQVSGFT